MADICSITSSPSLYSHAPSHIGHGQGQGHACAPPGQGRRSARRMTLRWDRSNGEVDHGESESEYGDTASTQHRISMVSGPRVTKYADLPWEDFADAGLSKGSSGNLGKMLRAATRTNGSFGDRSRPSSPAQSSGTMSTEATRKGLAIFGGGKSKNLMSSSSSSGVSLASNQTVSTVSSDDRAHPVTPRLRTAHGSSPASSRREVLAAEPGCDQFDMNSCEMFRRDRYDQAPRKLEPSPFPAHASPQLQVPDRPLLSSGSPGFGLISLEAAQERERQRAHRQTAEPPAQRSQPTTRPIPAPSADCTSHTESLPFESYALSAFAPKSVKQKKSLMKLFRNDKSGSTAGFSIVTPSLPSVPKMPSPEVSVMPIRSQPESHAGALSTRSGNNESDSGAARPTRPTPLPGSAHDSSARDVLLKPRLELRPISMNFSNGLPSSYMSDENVAPTMPTSPPPSSRSLTPAERDASVAVAIKEQIANARKGWMVQLYELEAQIRELKDALAEAKAVKPGRCEACGCACAGHGGGESAENVLPGDSGGVINRARVKTGGARGVFGSRSLYE